MMMIQGRKKINSPKVMGRRSERHISIICICILYLSLYGRTAAVWQATKHHFLEGKEPGGRGAGRGRGEACSRQWCQ